jgi:CYTH domain-containing protein
MALKREVERKFLVHAERLPPLPAGARLRQAYLGYNPTVRARTEEGPDGERRGYLTIKGEGLVGRDEFEYGIPFDEAEALLRLAQGAVVSKVRHRVPLPEEPSLAWEIDVFDGDNAGLIVAELELPDEDHPFTRPHWLGEDVTEDRRYKNAALAQHPYRNW